LIDDMEADTGLICRGDGRHGHWFSYNDMLSTTVQTPPRGVAPILPEAVTPPRGTSHYAMHTSGTFSSYLAIGCSLNGSDSNVPEIPANYDVSGLNGIRFYAKGTPIYIEAILITAETEPTIYGGTCTTSACSGNSTVIQLSSTTWQLYQLPFSGFTTGTAPLTLQHLFSIAFQAYSPPSADFWIDDLSFY
jgi:hypothetical protein